MSGADARTIRAQIAGAAAKVEGEVLDLSRRIYENPELSGEERLARGWCSGLLGQHGFTLDEVPGVETAFVASLTGDRSGPTVGLLAEYDSLPVVGHACGHHLIAGSAVGAGLAIAALREFLPGTVKVFGCPAEETGAGKAAMLESGAFDGVDAALTFHANDTSSVMTISNAIHELRFEFVGQASHAATAPWEGASALDGVLLTYQNVNALRQFVRDGVRLHGIVSHGGDAFNVIPERASCVIAVRSSDPSELARVVERVTDCARAAALASSTQVTVENGMLVEPVRFNPALAETVRKNLAEQSGEPVEDWNMLGSTDFGNVSNALPALLFSVKTWPEGTALHTREAAEFGGRAPAYAAMLTAMRVMATSTFDLMLTPELLDRVRASFKSSFAGA